MKNVCYKKTLVFGIIVLFIGVGVAPSINAIDNSYSEKINKKVSQNTSYTEDLPDLIIEDIIQRPDDIIYLQWLYCRVRNIGDEVFSGNVNIYFDLHQTLFTIIPIKYIKSYSGTVYSLEPGEAEEILIDRNDNIPHFGFYRFTCEVNPNEAVPEENYDNNYKEFDYFIFPFLGPWIKWFD